MLIYETWIRQKDKSINIVLVLNIGTPLIRPYTYLGSIYFKKKKKT